MSARRCSECGQSLPEEERRDPPLPPLDFPALVTIHDLSPEQRKAAAIVETFGARKLRDVPAA